MSPILDKQRTPLKNTVSAFSQQTVLLCLLACLLFGAFLSVWHWHGKSLEDDELYTMASATGYNLHLVSWFPDAADKTEQLDPKTPVPAAYYPQKLSTALSSKHFDKGLQNNIQAPLYPTVIRGLRQQFHQADVRVFRLLSALFAVLCIPLGYALGKQHFQSSGKGLLVAALVSVSGFLVHYAHVARLYTLLAFFSMAAIWLLLKYLSTWKEAHPSASQKCCYGVLLVMVCLLGLYTHYFFAFSVLFFAVYTLIRLSWQPAAWRQVGLAAIFLLLGCLPLFQLLWQQLHYVDTYGHFAATGLWHPAELFGSVFKHLTLPLAHKNVVLQGVLAVLLIAGIGFCKQTVESKKRLVFCGLWVTMAFLPLVAVDWLSHTHSAVKTTRYLTALYPAIVLLYAEALLGIIAWFNAIGRTRIGIFLVAGVLVLLAANALFIASGAFYKVFSVGEPMFKAVGQYINTEDTSQGSKYPRTLVVIAPSGVSTVGYAYYLKQNTPTIGLADSQKHPVQKRLPVVTQGYSRVWLICRRADKQLVQTLTKGFERLQYKAQHTRRFRKDIWVTLYQKKGEYPLMTRNPR